MSNTDDYFCVRRLCTFTIDSLSESNENMLLINLQFTDIQELKKAPEHVYILSFSSFFGVLNFWPRLINVICDYFGFQSVPGTVPGHFENSD